MLAGQALNFVIVDKFLYFVDNKGGGRKKALVPRYLPFWRITRVERWLVTFQELVFIQH